VRSQFVVFLPPILYNHPRQVRICKKDTTYTVERVVMEVVEKGKIRTYDMGGKATSLEIGKAIAEKM
jgi:isocitrate/isopropylmalate dehydrogenase